MPDDIKRTWCAILKSHCGKVSLLRGMTESEARKVEDTFSHRHFPKNTLYHVSDGTITMCKIFDGASPEDIDI